MTFTGQTRLADLLTHDSAAVARLAALDPTLAEAGTPLRLAADMHDLTLHDVAIRTGIALADILTVANAGPGGCGAVPDEGAAAATEAPPPWLITINLATTQTIDVRPILAGGDEPLSPVVEMARSLGPGGTLILDAPLNPGPLRRVLESMGFATFGRPMRPGHWRIWAHKLASIPPQTPPSPFAAAPVATALSRLPLAGAQQRLLREDIPIRFFTVGIVAHVLAWAGLFFAADDLAGFGGGPGWILGISHLLTVGVLLAVAMGASLQMLPVALARPAPATWACQAILLGLVLGLALLAYALIRFDSVGLAAGTTLLVGTVILYVGTLGRVLSQAVDLPIVRHHVVIALVSLVVAVLIAGTLSFDDYASLLADHVHWALAHALLAAYGFMGFLVLGLSHVLVPMFATADGKPAAADTWALRLAAAALAIGTGSLLIGVPETAGVAAGPGLAAAILHIHGMRTALRHRMRRHLGIEFRLIGLSWAMLVLSLGLAALVAFGGRPATGGALFFFVLLFGWLLTILTGVLQRILPFMASMHVARAGRHPISPSRLTWEMPLHGHFWAHTMALAITAGGIALDIPTLIRLGTATGTLGALAFAVFAIAVRIRTHTHLRSPSIAYQKGNRP